MRAPDPTPNPLRALPPPSLPPKNRGGRPRKDGTPAQPRTPGPSSPTAGPTAPPPAADGTRELPADPAERERVLEEVRPVAALVLTIAGVLASRLPPFTPLSAEEQSAIQPPLELVLHKYGGAMSPEWQLASAVGGIAAMRYMTWLTIPEANRAAIMAERRAVNVTQAAKS